MNRVICFVLVFIIYIPACFSQSGYTLQQCIDSAVANYIPVKQSGLLVEAAGVNRRQARMNLLPDLNASITHGLNSGRSIDPFTNGYVNQSVNTANYGINSGIIVFSGMTLQNRIKENAYAYDASRMEWQQSKDELVLNVILAYLTVLNNEDQVEVASRQAETSKKALERLEIMNSQGAIKPSDLSDLKGQLMNDQLAILNAKNLLESSRISLARLMNRPYDSSMKLVRIDMEEFLAVYPGTANDVYQQSLEQFAQVKAVELRTKTAAYSLKAVKGQLYPTVSIGGGINTNYSSVAQTSGQKIPYGSQLRNNRYSSIGLGITIPIFNASSMRNRVKLADINLRNAELEEENTHRQLQQEIDQAYVNMTTAYDRYKVLLDQVKAYQESFRAAEIRFNSGVGTSIDYLTAKDRLDRSNINLVLARYDFVLRKRILDYYSGKKQ